MSIDTNMSACARVLALTLFAGGAFACGDYGEETGGPLRATKRTASPTTDKSAEHEVPAEADVDKLRVLPKKSFSGYDGTHTFKVPIAVYESGDDLVVSASDPSALDLVPAKLAAPTKDAGKYFMITVNKPGVHTVLVKSKGQTAEVVLTATRYAPSQWTAGEQRYATSGVAGDPPCATCHRDGAAIDHSPAALSSVDDAKVRTVLTMGVSPAGFPIKINGKLGHKWTLTDEERAALVTYLRGLPPRAFE